MLRLLGERGEIYRRATVVGVGQRPGAGRLLDINTFEHAHVRLLNAPVFPSPGL